MSSNDCSFWRKNNFKCISVGKYEFVEKNRCVLVKKIIITEMLVLKHACIIRHK